MGDSMERQHKYALVAKLAYATDQGSVSQVE